ncbi:glycosyl hydrolase family protein 43 [Tanacetum coccineum]
MTQDATFEFERKRNRPKRYDRNLTENTLKGIKTIDKVRSRREETHLKNRRRLLFFQRFCTWTNDGIVLAAEETGETHDLHKSNVLERPKVTYNENTGKYIIWMHIDDTNYTRAAAGTAISSSPTGLFGYIKSFRPHGFESKDMTIFKDDDVKQTWWYQVDNDTLTREDAVPRFFDCLLQASNLSGIK